MSATQTATVETLTAEVRVLMVGSRQVTLSVAKQLDRVPLDALSPFGRVAIPDIGSNSSWHLIGRHRDSGVLCLASLPARLPNIPLIGGLTRPVTVCRADSRYTAYLFEGRRVQFDDNASVTCDIAGHYSGLHGGARCGHWQTNGVDGEIAAFIQAWDARRGAVESIWQMPLIVLAGLK